MYAICVLCVRADSTDTTFIVHVRRPLDLRGQRSKPLLVVTRKMLFGRNTGLTVSVIICMSSMLV
jgi:hypothetical protein